MDPSITTLILDGMTTRLQQDAAEQGVAVNVARSRRRPAEREELPLVTVRPLTEKVQKVRPNITCTSVQRELDVAITVRSEGEDADLDPIRSFVIESVMSDPSCGGLAYEIEEVSHDWEGDGSATDADYAEDTIRFIVRYMTARASAVRK